MALKILLADDNITAQKMGSKILTDAGYQVVAVSNGAAAMKKIASEKPELLILDVYMPGYTGLEVCQKVKSAPESSSVPVLLTVTNMEPFNPEDGNKVKADGVMVKPFEASDLLAVVQKFEAKLHPATPPSPEAEYVKTVKMQAMGFKDASNEEWKAEAAPEEEQAVVKPAALPEEIASAPVLGVEDMLVQPPVEAPAPPPVAFAPESAGFELSPTPPLGPERAEPVAEVVPVLTPAPEVEFTSAPQVGEVEIAPAPELELNGHAAAAIEVPVVQDPALVTDAADMAQFTVKFGEAPGQPSFQPAEQPAEAETAAAPPAEQIAEPEIVAAVPEISEEAPVSPSVPEEPAAEVTSPRPASEVTAEEPVVEIVEGPDAETVPVAEAAPADESSAVSLEEEMRRAFNAGSGAAAAPALAPEPAPEPVVETAAPVEPAAPVVEPTPPPPTAVPDKLVEQFAAELAKLAPAEVVADEAAPQHPGAEAAQAPAPVDEKHVAEAVQRVLERYKDELAAAIVRVLKS